MPIELDVWRIDDIPQRITPSRLQRESRLEEFLESDPTLISDEVLIIGRQVTTGYGKQIDLLALNADGQVVVIELKRDRTPRDVIAQLLDYGSWIQGLSYDDVVDLYEGYAGSPEGDGSEPRLEKAFTDQFGTTPPDTLNESHQLVVVASELDPSTERIVNYLTDEYAVPINAVFFRYFSDGDREYLTRTWLKDPQRMDAIESRSRVSTGKREPWNGQDFYVSFGEDARRSWEDAVRYGFVSAGGGEWYSQTLENLFPGARVFVCIPKEGYVGVGEVVGEKTPVTEFTVEIEGEEEIPILEAPLEAERMDSDAEAPERAEYLVPVEWIKTRPREEAIWEKGMYANQNTVTKLRNKFTLEKLIEGFDLEDESSG